MTPQLRQAIKLLQMSSTELEVELAEAVETNPLLEWAENAEQTESSETGERAESSDDAGKEDERPDWSSEDSDWGSAKNGSFDGDDEDDASDRVAEPETLADHLLWQLHLSPLNIRDRAIGA